MEFALLQVSIVDNLKSFRMNVYKKPGEGQHVIAGLRTSCLSLWSHRFSAPAPLAYDAQSVERVQAEGNHAFGYNNNVTRLENGFSLMHGKVWLGGLDSNQDSQIQSLESYQLDDLPAVEGKKESRHNPVVGNSHDSSHLI
jgi:hypothetical protein